MHNWRHHSPWYSRYHDAEYSRRCTKIQNTSPTLGAESCTPLCSTCVYVPGRCSLEHAADSRHRVMLSRGVLGGCEPSISSKAAPATLRGAPHVAIGNFPPFLTIITTKTTPALLNYTATSSVTYCSPRLHSTSLTRTLQLSVKA